MKLFYYHGMKVGKEECEVNSDRRLGLEGIVFTTFLKCGMLRELSSKQYLVILRCYLRFTDCSSVV